MYNIPVTPAQLRPFFCDRCNADFDSKVDAYTAPWCPKCGDSEWVYRREVASPSTVIKEWDDFNRD